MFNTFHLCFYTLPQLSILFEPQTIESWGKVLKSIKKILKRIKTQIKVLKHRFWEGSWCKINGFWYRPQILQFCTTTPPQTYVLILLLVFEYFLILCLNFLLLCCFCLRVAHRLHYVVRIHVGISIRNIRCLKSLVSRPEAPKRINECIPF